MDGSMPPGYPDMRCSLLHQKLQMLNLCLDKHLQLDDHVGNDDNDDDDDEIFYDCPNNESESPEPTTATTTTTTAAGRKKRLGKLKLLDSNEPLFVPVTQRPAPKTEDQLDEFGGASARLADSMSTVLHADMSAFKAANPTAKMADFIRWYSPRDWATTTDEDGNVSSGLSERMLAADNTWQSIWKKAQALPACLQEPLFDKSSAWLEVLEFLSTRNIGEIYELTVITVYHAAILKLKHEIIALNALDIFSETIDIVLTELGVLSRQIDFNAQSPLQAGDSCCRIPNLAPIIEKIENLERRLHEFNCFRRVCSAAKFGDVKRRFVEILKNDGFYELRHRRAVCQTAESGGNCDDSNDVLNEHYKTQLLENLISKDYVIRLDGDTTLTTPTAHSAQTGAQFLRANIVGSKIRLCGAFTESTTFI